MKLSSSEIQTLLKILPKEAHCLFDDTYEKHITPFVWNFIRSFLDRTENNAIPVEHIRYYIDRLLAIETSDTQTEKLTTLKKKLNAPELFKTIKSCRSLFAVLANAYLNDTGYKPIPLIENLIGEHFTWVDTPNRKTLQKLVDMLSPFLSKLDKQPKGTCEPKNTYEVNGMTLRFFANDTIQLSETETLFTDRNYLKLERSELDDVSAFNLYKDFKSDAAYKDTFHPALYAKSRALFIAGGALFAFLSVSTIVVLLTVPLAIIVSEVMALSAIILAFAIDATLFGFGLHHRHQAKEAESWIEEQIDTWYAALSDTFDDKAVEPPAPALEEVPEPEEETEEEVEPENDASHQPSEERPDTPSTHEEQEPVEEDQEQETRSAASDEAESTASEESSEDLVSSAFSAVRSLLTW